MNTSWPLPILTVTILAGLGPAVASVSAFQQEEPEARAFPSDPVFEVTPTDGPSFSARLRRIDEEGRFAFVDLEGEERLIPAPALVKLTGPNPESTGDPTVEDLLVFPDGDRLRGIVDRGDDLEIQVRSGPIGLLKVPLEALLGFSLGTITDRERERRWVRELLTQERRADQLWLSNGDRLSGALLGFDGGAVRFETDAGERELDRNTVEAVGLDPALARYPEPDGLSFDFCFTDTTRLRLTDLTFEDGVFEGTTRFGSTVRVKAGLIRDLYVIGGPVVYLSDLEPAGALDVPYIGPAHPHRVDANALGLPLVASNRPYARGIGTRTRALLAYRLPEDARRFQALVAVDDAAGPLGNVVFRVLLDNQERFASDPLSAGDEPVPIDLDVQGADLLILASEYGQRGDVRDLADWIEARVILSEE